MKSSSPFFTAAAIATLFPFSTGTSHAALLIHEGFDGYTAGILKNQNVSGSATGLTGVWGGNGGADTLGTITTGLTFGSLQTSGGALRITGTTVVLGAATTASHTGTLWHSQLVSLSGAQSTTASNNGAEIRIADDAGGAVNSRYRTFADSRTTSSTVVGVDYNTGDSSDIASSGTSLAFTTPIPTTYIMISTFTEVGSATGTAASATTWALNLAQFQAMVASPLGAEAYLLAADNTQYTAKATDTDTTKATDGLASGDFLQLLSVGDNLTYDEIRFGQTLGDVIPLVPEPGTAALAMLGGLVLLRRKR